MNNLSFRCKRCMKPIAEFDYYCPCCARNLIGRLDAETIEKVWAWMDANIAEHFRMDRVMGVPPHRHDWPTAVKEQFLCATSEMDSGMADD